MDGVNGPKAPIRDWVAIILAVGLASSVTIITIAVLYEAIEQNAPLSENATQVLTTAFSGIVGILGAYVGFREGTRRESERYDSLRDPGAATEVLARPPWPGEEKP